jgi:hypothetical protein
MDHEDFEYLWDWEIEDDTDEYLLDLTEELVERFFLSDNAYMPDEVEEYQLGYLDPEDWWPLANQLREVVNLERLLHAAANLDDLLGLPGLPTEILEDPLTFLQSALQGHLPRLPSGRKVGSRRLVAITLAMIDVMGELPEVAQAAVRAWADVHRRLVASVDYDEYDDDYDEYDDYEDFEAGDFSDLLFPGDLPLAMTGFSMVVALTLMRWPERAEGMPLPAEFKDPELYHEVLHQWETLPESPTAGEEGASPAEALFSQGKLAHMLAQMAAVEVLTPEEPSDEEIDLSYSRLSRAMLWIYDQCRSCPARDEVACKAATGWPERPVPLLDIAGEIANTGRIAGCIKM